ncbi:NAD(P)/FAD-dependent oxidoreductase [Roseitranquillus sediminis]|uniref:NAD(P)/FAD-dependent oxidoreductase n=1 Tax=Roseitranquillus sediminis TaxID=2809051 RepID=UPI001D0C7989|nr:FAD-dependent oxidoreductase [Roseitranquillus sediminis]MBM9593477.1 FAD-dependent oxidoreductase [Roseitranquillus sediminis]
MTRPDPHDRDIPDAGTPQPSRIVIIGAGHGGAQLAASLVEEGHPGTVTLISAEDDAPYHKPPLSKSFMKAPDTPLQPLRGRTFFIDKGIDMRLGAEVTSIDCRGRRVLLADGSEIPYDRLVLATGTRARRLAVPGVEQEGVFHLRTAGDARAMRRALPESGRVVVIGGGFIGLEAAAMLAARGLSVEVLEVAPHLLRRAVSRQVADAVTAYLEGQGIGIRCGVCVDSLGGEGRVTSVRLEDGPELQADMVVVGIGAVPEVALAEASGLACDNGIVTDALLTTSDPAICAIGDCISYPQAQLGRMARLESVQNATDQARALAKTLTGKPTPYGALPWFWSDIGALKLQIAGLAHDADEDVVVQRADGALQSVYRLSQGRLVAVETLNSAGEHMLARRLIAKGITPDREVMASGDMAALKAAYAAARARRGEARRD